MALDKKDLSAIKKIVKDNQEELKEIIKDSQEELAEMVGKSFLNVEKRFDNIDKKFDNVEKRFNNVEKDIKHMKMSMIESNELLHRIDLRTHNQQRTLDDHELAIRQLKKHTHLSRA